VFHVRTVNDAGDVLGEPEMEAALTALHTFLGPCYRSCGVNGLAWTSGAGVVDVVSQEMYDFTTRTETNSVADGAAPPALAIVVGWKTSSGTRRGRGRTFLGPVRSGTIQSDGTVSTTILGDLNAAATTLVNASLVDNGWAVGVYGQENAGDPGGHVLRDFQGHKIRDVFAVLRSRRD
jgi:hypothetical protein